MHSYEHTKEKPQVHINLPAALCFSLKCMIQWWKNQPPKQNSICYSSDARHSGETAELCPHLYVQALLLPFSLLRVDAGMLTSCCKCVSIFFSFWVAGLCQRPRVRTGVWKRGDTQRGWDLAPAGFQCWNRYLGFTAVQSCLHLNLLNASLLAALDLKARADSGCLYPIFHHIVFNPPPK